MPVGAFFMDSEGNFPSEYGKILKFKILFKLKKIYKTKPKYIKYMLAKLSRQFWRHDCLPGQSYDFAKMFRNGKNHVFGN